MTSKTNREVHLRSRPVGMPQADNFSIVERPIPTPAANEILVRNLYMTVDPYMRGLMIDHVSYLPAYEIGEVLHGGAVGEVVAAPESAAFKAGDIVRSMNGWREWFVSDGSDLHPVDTTVGTARSHLGALGMPGLTAYVGLLHVAGLREGERVFVSAAAGAVGTLACQIAKAKGCYVVGSAGSDEKCRYLTGELGVDRAINYKTAGDLGEAVASAFPDGIDVYFENVGGAHLEAALDSMRSLGRIAVCGMIDGYNAIDPSPGPRNIFKVIPQQLTIKGFMVPDDPAITAEFHRDMAKWTASGAMAWRETILDGIERAPEAFIGLFKGENIGKMLVRLDSNA